MKKFMITFCLYIGLAFSCYSQQLSNGEISFENYNSLLTQLEEINTLNTNTGTSMSLENEMEQTFNQRYDIGAEIIELLLSNLDTYTYYLEGSELQSDLNLSMNVWSNNDFRNAYDKIEDWGTTAGFALSSGTLLSKSENMEELAGAGLLIVGISKLLGTLFGTETGDKFEETISFVDVTRRAYDDLRERHEILQSLINYNNKFRNRTLSFLESYINVTNDREQKTGNILKLNALIEEYDKILSQIPLVYEQYLTMINKYCSESSCENLDAELSRKFTSIKAKIEDLQNKYDEHIRPHFVISYTMRAQLLGI